MWEHTRESRRWLWMRLAYYAGLGAFFVMVAFYFGPNEILFGQLTWITPEYFAPTVQQRCRPIVAAINAYRQDNGVYPDDIHRLDPNKLPAMYGPCWINDGEFSYLTEFNHMIKYQVGPAGEDWYVRGPYVNGRIPVPLVTIAPTSPTTQTR